MAHTGEGVDKIEIDAAKDTVAITGDGDPYEIIVQARKAVKCGVEVVTIGPPPKKPDEKKPDEKKPGDEKPKDKGCTCIFPPPYIHYPHSCLACRQVAVVHMNPDPCTTCSIM
ncbi:hypothetical protein CTI12_AA357070 [Artemisia annua]|uniref:Heavy metal-associated domain, HMA n=1 Tax=Artemisia annua TaxID=35608 RepID=A0A2U1LSU4_ARTAN|nr:hypothetical protein CTI12_AA357070 [Artemisia annua]